MYTLAVVGFEWDDILIWGSLLVFTTVFIVLAMMKMWKTRRDPVEPGSPPKVMRWMIPIIVLLSFWFLTAYRCYLFLKYA